MRWLRFIVVATFLVGALPGVASAADKRPGALVGPVRLVSTSSDLLNVDGNRYFGEVELKSAADGLVVINRLALERYLLGLAEVPRTWPEEALRAQAVAARTYALYTLSRPRAGAAATYGFDICASVECQVFAGAEVVEAPDGERWSAAVRSTANQAILYRGRPILARYHSTSGGRTLENSEVFTDERSYPYLQSVPSPTEHASPLFRWRVPFTYGNLQSIFEAAGLWSRGALKEVKTAPSRTGAPYPDVVMVGADGKLRMNAQSWREVLGSQAPELFPGLYPSPWRTTSGFLPETLPSNRIEIERHRNGIVIVGRGWGHGVGMSQWGAHGMALQGADYRDILEHYYTGVNVTDFDEPETIAVGIDWGESSVTVSGAFKIVDGRGRVVVDEALGTWKFTYGGSGAVSVTPPQGFGLPLSIGVVHSPQRAKPGEKLTFTVALSKPARVKTVTSGLSGYEDAGASIRSAGRRKIAWKAPTAPGQYDVTVQARAGDRVRRSESVRVLVSEDEDRAKVRTTGPAAEESQKSHLIVVAVVIGLVAVGGVVLAGKIRR